MINRRTDAPPCNIGSRWIPGLFCLVICLFSSSVFGLFRSLPSYAADGLSDPCSSLIDFQEIELGQSKRLKCSMTTKLLPGIPDGTPLVISPPDQFTTTTPEITFNSNNPPTLDIEARLDPARTMIGPYYSTIVILAKTGPDRCAWLSFEIPIRVEVLAPSPERLVQQWNLALAKRAFWQRKMEAKMEELRDTADFALTAESMRKPLGLHGTSTAQKLRQQETTISHYKTDLSMMGRQAFLAEKVGATQSIPAASVESSAPPPPPPPRRQPEAGASSWPFSTPSVSRPQATATPEATQKPADAYWNSVISPINRDSMAVADLIAGCQYRIHFDIAAFDYSLRSAMFGAAASSVSVNPALENYVASIGGTDIELQTVPFIFGAVQFKKNPPPEPTISIDAHKLLLAHPVLPATESLPDFAKAASAGRYTVDVIAGSDNTAAIPQSGCGSVGISLWSPEDPPQPMGYVVRYLRVADSSGRFPRDCANQNIDEAAAPANLINKLPLHGDATLYVFRLNDPPNSVAVFQSPGRAPETWLLQQHPEDSLNAMIDQVNSIDAAPSRSEGTLAAEPADPQAYHQIYEAIQRDVFTALYKKQSGAPESALKIIRDIAKDKAAKKQRARFVVLIAGQNGREVFYPMGLLSDGGSPPKPLAMIADFVEELPSQTIRPSCIPTPKADLADMVTECHLDQITVPPSTVFSGLKGDLSASHTSELLLLLAHQGKGNLSFEDPNDLLRPGELGSFEANSAGILLACNPDVNDLRLGSNWPLEFNRKGMGALVFSPFLVPEDFAACFASTLSDNMNKAIASDTPITLSQLYRDAIGELRAAGWKKRSEIAYQFILAGDIELPICKQTPSSASH